MKNLEFKPNAGIALSNCGGIEMMIKGETVYYRFNYGQDLHKEEILESEIQFDQEGAAYFIHKTDICETDQTYYLNEATNF